jgi:hypothetical protein
MKLIDMGKRWLPIVVLLAFAAPAALSQNAQLSGKVTDPSAAAVPGVEINITNIENGSQRKLITNDEGYYAVPSLQPGHYRLSALKEGFKPLTREGLTLQVSDNVKLDLKLELGSTSETVTITGDVELLRTDDAQTGQLIDNRRIQELPQYNRNALAFAQLAAGVSGTADQPGKVIGGNEVDFRISGGRTVGSEYVIDGVPITDGYAHNIPPSVPSPEAVQEFKVITNGMSAEYGRLSGGVVVLATRAGTNQFHGSAYEFLKNDKLNANDWNSNRYSSPKGAFHNNIFGGTLGGPIWIPKVYDGHNKTFFFLGYEGNRFSSGSNSSLAGVPTELERNGDFSQTLADQGAPAQIYDPHTGVLQADGSVIRQLFPGNLIPTSQINPISSIYNGYYPKPNHAPLAGSSHDSNYIGASTSLYHNNRWTGRLDQSWSSTQMTFLTVTNYDDESANPSWLGPMASSSDLIQNAKTAALHHVVTLNPTTVVEARLGVVRNTGPGAGSTGTTGLSTLASSINSANWGFQPEVYSIMGTTVGRAPSINVNGDSIAGLGGGGGALTFETDYSASLSLQKLVGKHSFKMGWEHRRYYTNQYVGGSFYESSDRTTTQMNPLNYNGSGSGYASFLLGNTTWGGGNQWSGPASLQAYHAAYFQDDIKLTNKLTINAGIRWDFEPPRTERYNREIFWDSKYKWDIQPVAGWSWQQNLQEAGVTGSIPEPYWVKNGFYGRPAIMGSKEYPGRTIQESYPFHFSPHLGLAYQIQTRTVMRLSYGMNWLSMTGNRFLNTAAWNNADGGSASIQRGSTNNGLTYGPTFQNPMLGGIGYIPYVAGSEQTVLNTALGQWYLAQATNTYPGYEHAFQFSLQQQLGSGAKAWVLEANVSATLGRKLPWADGVGEEIMKNAYNVIGQQGVKLNAQVSNPVYGIVPTKYGAWANSGQTTPLGRVLENNPLYGEAWTMGSPAGTSNYTALYLQAEHRFGNGFSLLTNYTFSKMLQDTGSNEVYSVYDSNGYPQAGLGLGDVYGVASNDRTHRFMVNYSYDLPFGRGKRLLGNAKGPRGAVLDKVVGGWTIAGTTTYRSGSPLSINSQGGFWSGIGQGRQPMRAVFLNRDFATNVSGHAALQGAAGSTPYFNLSSFGFVQGAQIGDVPATMPYLRGPGYSQWDIALMKNFKLWSETSHLQLRAEAQNAFNHMNAANPDTNQTDSTFGYITGQASSPRVVMVAAKIVF